MSALSPLDQSIGAVAELARLSPGQTDALRRTVESLMAQESAGSRPPSLAQLKVLQAIHTLREQLGVSPTYMEIAQHVGVRSINSVSEHVRRLVAKGLLRAHEGRSRSLSLTTAGSDAVSKAA